MSADKTPSVPAVERALHILEALASSKNGLSLSQLLDISGVPKSSLHCLLLTLERNGYLHRSPQSGRYLFGLKLLTLANSSLHSSHIREQAAPFLMRLMETTRLTVHMAVHDNHEAVLIAKYDAPGSARLATWRGKKMEVHCTGLGKALGAFLPPEELEHLYLSRGFPRHNENTLTSLRKVREDFALVRQRMYSIDDEEDELGHRCIGAPIFDASGRTCAAISLAGTISQIDSSNMYRLADKLKSCALGISHALGLSKNENAYKPA